MTATVSNLSANLGSRLGGPFEWQGLAGPALRIALVWAIALVLMYVARHLGGLIRHEATHLGHINDPKRVATLTAVFKNTATVVIIGIALMLTLGELGIQIAPVLATAGVAGVAVGFGAQTLVKDFFSGLFILLENQASEGDTIEAAGKTGVVEHITLRHIRLRDYDGSVHFIPNNVVAILTNRSRDYGCAVVDIDVPRSDSVERYVEAMEAVGKELRADKELAPFLRGEVEVAGVQKIETDHVVLRSRLKAAPLAQEKVKAEFLRRLASRIDAGKA